MKPSVVIPGGMVMLALAASALVVVPWMQTRHVEPTPGLKPYSATELRGRESYIRNGCIYCHSQQPRSVSFAPDAARGWGRASVAGDYVYDQPHLLGTMRTGPDLFNIGARQPSAEWHLGHLYEPRAYVPHSIMPAFPWLFRVVDKSALGDTIVAMPEGFAPIKGILIAGPEALDLVAYLKALDRTFPALGVAP